MKKPILHQRNIKSKLYKAIQRSPVVLVIGPRQSGKTTLIKELSDYHFVTLDDIRFLQAAQNDPMGFIAQLPKPVIIDEIQRAPDLFLAIKHDVDQHRTPGRYILSGSANPLLIPKIGDSLAGRVEILTLYPFSQGELSGVVDSFVDFIWSNENLMNVSYENITLHHLYQRIVTGGYPSVQNISSENQEQWFHDYIATILQKDMIDLAVIEHIKDMPRLLSLCAARAGSLVNVSELGRQARISTTTLQRYILMLETLFIIIMQQAWNSNLTKRVIKSPKSYLVDTGLLCWLRMTTVEKLENDEAHDKGHIVENFVVNELMKQLTWCSSRVNLYHFRAASNQEVDIVLERIDGKIIGIEVKSNEHVSAREITGLQYLKESAPDAWHRGIVLYGGNVAIPLTKDIIALPISALWGSKK